MRREEHDLYPDVSSAEMRAWAREHFRRAAVEDPLHARGGAPTRERGGPPVVDVLLVGAMGAAAAAFAFWWWRSGKAEARQPGSYLRGLDGIGALAA